MLSSTLGLARRSTVVGVSATCHITRGDSNDCRLRMLTLGALFRTRRFASSTKCSKMDYDRDKVDEVVLALMYLTTFENRGGYRAMKQFALDHLDRLEDKALIGGVRTQLKSIVLTTLGEQLSARYFRKHFADGLEARENERAVSAADNAR